MNQPMPEVDRNINDRALWGDTVTEMMRDTHFMVAGVGGAGSAVAFMLVRAGAEHITIADPDTSSLENANRQPTAFEDTVGMKKVHALAQEARRIRSDVDIRVLPNGVITHGSDANMDEFFDHDDTKTPYLIEAVGFEHPEISVELCRHARSIGATARTSIEVGAGSQGTGFHPDGATAETTFEGFIGVSPDDPSSAAKGISVANQLTYIPPYIDKQILFKLADPDADYPTPASAGGVGFNGGLLEARIRAEMLIRVDERYGQTVVDEATGLTLADSLFYPYVQYMDPLLGVSGFVHHDQRGQFLADCIAHEPNIPIDFS